MAAERIVRLTGASWAGTSLTTPTNYGPVRAGWKIDTVRKQGRSSGERGDTTKDKTFHRVTGFIELDGEKGAETALLTNGIGQLVLNWVTQGGTAKTTTFGNGTTSGVVFTGTSGTKIAEGAEAGPTTRTRVNFEFQFDPAATSVGQATIGIVST